VTPCVMLVRHGGDYTTVRWIRATLVGRAVAATLNGSSVRVAVSRGSPQWGVLSPLLWCLVVDDLIVRISGSGIYIPGYTDDVVGKFPNTVSGFMQWSF
jgi:hypothetical protein